MYAYEVDGLGNSLSDTDDPNVPSLLAAPLLGYTPLDAAVFQTTHRRLLSADENPFYFAGMSAAETSDYACSMTSGAVQIRSFFHQQNHLSDIPNGFGHHPKRSLSQFIGRLCHACCQPIMAECSFLLQGRTRRGWGPRTRRTTTCGRCPGWWRR